MQVSVNRVSAHIPVSKETHDHNEARLAAKRFDRRRKRAKAARASRKQNRT